MTTLLLSVALLAADDFKPLQGTWINGIGAELVIINDVVTLYFEGEEEFTGFIRIPKPGRFHVVVGDEVLIEAKYTIVGDKLTLTIDCKMVEYKRKPKEGRG